MPFSFDADEAARILGQTEDDQKYEGMREIAKSLAIFRNRLVEEKFSAYQAFTLTRDWFGVLLDAGYLNHQDEDEED